jgi:hypothetical protein
VIAIAATGRSSDTGQLCDGSVEVVTHLADATGRFVTFVHGDDAVSPAKIARQLDSIASTPGARWSLVTAVDLDATARPVHLRRCPPAGTHVAHELLRFRAAPPTLTCLLAERALVEEIGGLDVRLDAFAAWDLALRLALAAPGAMVDRPLVARRSTSAPAQLHEELATVEAKYRHVRAERGGLACSGSARRDRGHRLGRR